MVRDDSKRKEWVKASWEPRPSLASFRVLFQA